MSTGYWTCATDCEGCEDCCWEHPELTHWKWMGDEVARMHDEITRACMLPKSLMCVASPGRVEGQGADARFIADSPIPAGAMVQVLDNSRVAMATSPITPANCMHPRVFNLKCVDCGATALHTFSPAPDPNVKAVAPLVTKCPCGRSGCPDQKMHEIYEELRNRGKQLDEPCEGLKCRTNGGALDSGKFTCIVCGWKWELLGSRWTCMPRINVVAATISTEPALVRCKGCNASSNYARNHHLQLCWDCAEKR